MLKKIWYCDYIRATDDTRFVFHHFLKDFIFHHRLRFIIYFRCAKFFRKTPLRYFYEYKLYKFSRKYGIEIKSSTNIGKGFVLTHAYNITVSPHAKIGDNVTILKGATIGLSSGKRSGAPTIGNRVYIGINSTIVGGITIGDDVLIAPNTFINEDVPSHSLVVGNPCKIIPKQNATKDYIYYLV